MFGINLGSVAGGLLGGPLGGAVGGALFDSVLGGKAMDEMIKGGTGVMSMIMQPLLNDMLSDLGPEEE